MTVYLSLGSKQRPPSGMRGTLC